MDTNQSHLLILCSLCQVKRHWIGVASLAVLYLHDVVDLLDICVAQPQRCQAEHPGVMLLALLQTLDVVLHRLAQEALPVGPQAEQGLLVQPQFPFYLGSVPEGQRAAPANRSGLMTTK